MYDKNSILKLAPRADFLTPPAMEKIKEAEMITGKIFPELIHTYIRDFGSIQIKIDSEKTPFLILLGLGDETSEFDNICLFNAPLNAFADPSVLVFAHEFDGEADYIYGMRNDGKIISTCNHFPYPSIINKSNFKIIPWIESYDSLEQFWEKKVVCFIKNGQV
jgi:hypothetical protein